MISQQLIETSQNPKLMKILVCSSNQLKHGAVLDAARRITREAINIQEHAALSNIPNQPLGDGQTLLGAVQRAGTCVPGHYVVAIENGVMLRKDGFVDLAYIVVIGPSGHVTVRSSRSVPVPLELVAASKASGQLTTCSQLQAAQKPGSNQADPHIVWSGGTASRRGVLADAVEVALRAALDTEFRTEFQESKEAP